MIPRGSILNASCMKNHARRLYLSFTKQTNDADDNESDAGTEETF